MPKVSAPAAWDTRTNAGSIVVAVTDTGIDYNHPDLAGNMWQNANGYFGYDAVNNDNYPMDDNSYAAWAYNTCTGQLVYRSFEIYHGTHVAGTIGAVGNNNQGVTGIAWSVDLMAVKVLDSWGSGTAANVAEGLDFARTNGADIVNASWGLSAESALISDAIEALSDAGVIFVNAAGNSGNNNDSVPSYPGNYGFPNTIVVGASDSSDQRSIWPSSDPCYPVSPTSSNWGRWSIDVFAPGTGIYSTKQGNRYQSLNGTSMATPYVTGELALLKAQFPSESGWDLIDRVRFSVDSVSALGSISSTGGRINAATAFGSRPILSNGSGRIQVNTGQGIAIAGINVSGSSSKRVVFRAWGPSLGQFFGVVNPLANPQITVYNASGISIGSNNDWGSLPLADRNEIATYGLTPLHTLDSAWIGSLAPGTYTVALSGVSSGTGIGLIESFDVDGSTVNRLVNTSTRCFVGTGSQVAIHGITVSGNKPRQVYVRVWGPSLTALGISGVLSDPYVSLRDSAGTLITSNDDWQSFDGTSTALETRLQEWGRPPQHTKDSAIVARLNPGSYTLHVSGAGGATGIALVEVNEF